MPAQVYMALDVVGLCQAVRAGRSVVLVQSDSNLCTVRCVFMWRGEDGGIHCPSMGGVLSGTNQAGDTMGLTQQRSTTNCIRGEGKKNT